MRIELVNKLVVLLQGIDMQSDTSSWVSACIHDVKSVEEVV